MKFHVSHIGQNYGPWSVEEILARLAKMELLASDFIFDEDKNEWIPLMNFGPVLDGLKNTKPQGKPDAPKAAPVLAPAPVLAIVPKPRMSEKTEWFISRGSLRFGPLSYAGVIRGLQEKSIYEYELTWKEGMDEWVRLAEHPSFSAETIKTLVQEAKVEDAILQRQYPRFTYMNEVMVHDNRSLFMGQTFQGGEGGAGVIIENATLLPGQILNLHFSSHDGVQAFNAECEIVSKRYVKDVRNKHSPIPYGVKFVRIDQQVRARLKDYFTNRKAA